jgi:hypothetical protein
MADVGDHLVLGEGRELGGAPGLAGRTRAAPEAIPALKEVLPCPLDALVQGFDERVKRGLGRSTGPVDSGRKSWFLSLR